MVRLACIARHKYGISVTVLDFYYVYANLKDHSMWNLISFDYENKKKRNIAQNCDFMKSTI